MTRLSLRGIAVLAAALALAPAARAGYIPLFNTGVDASGTPRPDGSVGDLHYTLISVPSSTTTQTMIRRASGGYPIGSGAWIGDNSTSAWIGPNTDHDLDGVYGGQYVYRITFDLTGFDATTTSITGRFATDDSGMIMLNGANTPIVSQYGFSNWTNFTLTSGFVAGVNTLDFRVNNSGGGPTGLRVEMTGQADSVASQTPAVPAPPGVVLAGLGCLGMFGGLRLRRRFAPAM